MPKNGNKNTEGNVVPTLAEYIAQQITSKRAASLNKSRNRTMPAMPIINGAPNKNSCIYTATDNYGNQYRVSGNWTFYENPDKYGFKPISLEQAVPGDITQVFDKGTPYHAMTLDSFDEQGRMKYNYSRGSSGDESDIVKASTNFPNTKKAAYTFVGTQADSTQWTNDYKKLYGNQMKCGGRRKAQLGLDIREGGIAIPIAPNMYYMNGRSHDNGGIAIGPNNKNGLEVEGGEVVKVGKNDVKVFSSVPLLRGVSPAQLVMGGANPNKVFKAQEEFKDRNRINDDGSRYEIGGEKIIHINDLPSSFRGQLRNGKYVQIGIPPITNKAKSWNNTFKDHLNSLNVEMKNFIMDGIKYGKQILPKPLRKYYARGINILNSPGVEGINNTAQKITQIRAMIDEKKAGGIYIKPSKRGTFTAAATKHGMGVQEFASKVLANKEDYSPAMVKKANFARNASRWKKEYGGDDTKTVALKRIRNKFTIASDYGGGMFGGAGAGSLIMPQPEYVNDTIIKRYLVPLTQTFNDAFKNARNNGQNEFMFDGKLYNTELGDNPNNNAAGNARTSTIIIPIEHKEIRRRKKEFGGSMIYTINGNVKNGLMSARPKAQYGKEVILDKNTKVGADGLIYKWKVNDWYTDGTIHPAYRKINIQNDITNQVKKIRQSSITNAKKNLKGFSLDDMAVYTPLEDKETKKIGSIYYEKNNNGQWVPSSNQSSVTSRGGNFIGYGTNRVGINHPNGKYKYHPLTGEKLTEQDVVETPEPSVEGTTKVASKPSSTPRGRVTKTSTPKTASQSTPTIQDTVNKITADAWKASMTPKIDLSKVEMSTFDVSKLESKKTKEDKAKLNTPSTGGGTQSKDGRWIGQYKTTNAGDWIGLGSNVLGNIASYFITKNAINKMPSPVKPVMAQAAKLKTKYNVES